MDRSNHNSAPRQRGGVITCGTAGALTLLTLWMSCGSACANTGPAGPPAIVLRDDVRAVRIEPDMNSIGLEQAAFFHPFRRDLVSESGTRRRHAAIRAVLIPRDARGALNRSAAREARIDRSAAGDTLVFANLGTLTVSPGGTLSGQLRSGDTETWNTGAYLMLAAVVFDQVRAKVPDERLTDEFKLPQARFEPRTQASEAENLVSSRFFLYKEWSPDWGGLPKPAEGQGVDAHFAVRRWFSLLLLSRLQEYDPNEHPLQAYCPARNEGAVMTPMVVALSVMGGIEPYEVRTGVLPPGLQWDSRSLTISGVPEQAGSYSVAIDVKDAQFPAGDWEQARSARETLGTPYRQLTATFDIRKPLEAELVLPPYSRKGDDVWAVCLYEGGLGRAVFEGLKLPPGIQIDRESGRIYGVPTQVGQYLVEVRVTSPATADNRTVQRATAAGTWRIIEPLPARAIR